MNIVFLSGHLGEKPATKQAGKSKVCNVSMATNETYTEKDGEKKQVTDWHNLVFWGNKAEIVEKYCDKGAQLLVTGKLKTRSYDDNSGVKRYVTEVLVDTFEFVGQRKERQSSEQQQHENQANASSEVPMNIEEDSNLPF